MTELDVNGLRLPIPYSRITREERAACEAEWPECQAFEYHPSCCRFPKSCSAPPRVPATDPPCCPHERFARVYYVDGREECSDCGSIVGSRVAIFDLADLDPEGPYGDR